MTYFSVFKTCHFREISFNISDQNSSLKDFIYLQKDPVINYILYHNEKHKERSESAIEQKDTNNPFVLISDIHTKCLQFTSTLQ